MTSQRGQAWLRLHGQAIHFTFPVASPWPGTGGMQGAPHWQRWALPGCMAATGIEISIAFSAGLSVAAMMALAWADSVWQQTSGPSLAISSAATVTGLHANQTTRT